jgi:hypothetical protein
VLYFYLDIPIGGDKMSFEDFNKEELAKIADEFVLDVEDADNEDELRAAVGNLSQEEVALSFPQWAHRLELESDEDDEEDSAVVTSDNTPKKGAAKKTAKKAPAKKAAAKTAESKSKTVVPDDRTLLKMTRNNPVYEVRGYRFTRQMPYVFVQNADVDFLVEVEGGFAVAKPSEVEDFFN